MFSIVCLILGSCKHLRCYESVWCCLLIDISSDGIVHVLYIKEFRM